MLKKTTIKRLVNLWNHDRDNLIQKVRKKARNQLPLDKMLNSTGKALHPINLTFEMTHLCNLSCYMCDLYGTDAETEALRSQTYLSDELMTLENMKSVIDDVKSFKPSISLTGGEPMLSPMTLPFIKYASEAGLVVTMTTNGFKLEQHADALIESGLRNITLSIDGVDHVHDDVRGKPGTFETTKRGLKEFQKKKKEKGKALPHIQFNVTMCGRNQDQLLPIIEFAHDHEVDRIVFSHLWYWDEKMVEVHNQNYGHIAPVEIQNIRALEKLNPKILSEEIELIRQSPLTKYVDIKFLPEISEDQIEKYYTESMAVVRPTHHCLAPWMNTRILPNGDVIPCIDSVWGNLKSMTFSEAWNSPEAQKFRGALKDTGVFPGCMRCCGLYSYE